MVVSLPASLTPSLVAAACVVATWMGQLRPSLQGFAFGVRSAQSGIMDTLIHFLDGLDKGLSSRKLFLAYPDPDPHSAC